MLEDGQACHGPIRCRGSVDGFAVANFQVCCVIALDAFSARVIWASWSYTVGSL